ncbi:response regulator [Dyella monticola]|nr:response regulator [Dyella monticola]
MTMTEQEPDDNDRPFDLRLCDRSFCRDRCILAVASYRFWTAMSAPSIHQLKAFLVEDQPMVASTLKDALAAAGIAVIGHAGDIRAALAWIDRGEIADVALIDLMLPSGPAYPVVDRLRDLPTPILLITGVCREQIPAAYQDVACLEKPFGVHDLLKAITALRP